MIASFRKRVESGEVSVQAVARVVGCSDQTVRNIMGPIVMTTKAPRRADPADADVEERTWGRNNRCNDMRPKLVKAQDFTDEWWVQNEQSFTVWMIRNARDVLLAEMDGMQGQADAIRQRFSGVTA